MCIRDRPRPYLAVGLARNIEKLSQMGGQRNRWKSPYRVRHDVGFLSLIHISGTRGVSPSKRVTKGVFTFTGKNSLYADIMPDQLNLVASLLGVSGYIRSIPNCCPKSLIL